MGKLMKLERRLDVCKLCGNIGHVMPDGTICCIQSVCRLNDVKMTMQEWNARSYGETLLQNFADKVAALGTYAPTNGTHDSWEYENIVRISHWLKGLARDQKGPSNETAGV